MATTFAVPDGRVAMAATLWAGNNSTKSISNAVNGISFQPGLVWLKDRTQSQYHTLYDSTRYIGPTRSLILPLTDAEHQFLFYFDIQILYLLDYPFFPQTI